MFKPFHLQSFINEAVQQVDLRRFLHLLEHCEEQITSHIHEIGSPGRVEAQLAAKLAEAPIQIWEDYLQVGLDLPVYAEISFEGVQRGNPDTHLQVLLADPPAV